MSTEPNTHNTQLAAHETLSDFLTRTGVGGGLESEMKPERIGYGILENLTVGIRMFKKPSSVGQLRDRGLHRGVHRFERGFG